MKKNASKRSLLRDNGLSIVLATMFLLSLIGQSIAGHRADAEERREHAKPEISYVTYLKTDHFYEAIFENWESEFLQMAMYVLLTAFLFQRGSAESNDPDQLSSSGASSASLEASSASPGFRRFIYEHSLSLTFAALFLVSFLLHANFGARLFSADQRAHGQGGTTVPAYFFTSRFWYESFQNWQSEFLSILAMVVLSIFLRERGSPESKDVDAPNHQTGA